MPNSNMPPFEATRSFCYQFGRYTVLAEIEAMPEVKAGAEFRMVDLTQQILDKYLTLEQQQVRIKKANSEQTEPLHSIVKFFASFIAKQNDLFVRVRPGIYRAHSEDEIAAAEEGITDAQIEDAAIADGDAEAVEFDGWVYAFSFPALVRPDVPFPIKIGMTTGTVEERVAFQCKGSATFDNPVILGRWQVNRVGATEKATHNVLKARGKWRENIPGIEWFNTTIAEVESIISFVTET
jgi:hypothetical protein